VYLARYPDVLRSFGIPVAKVSEVSGIYPDLAHAEDWDRTVEAFCEEFCLMGTPTTWRRR
jgi:hypothetical protein